MVLHFPMTLLLQILLSIFPPLVLVAAGANTWLWIWILVRLSRRRRKAVENERDNAPEDLPSG